MKSKILEENTALQTSGRKPLTETRRHGGVEEKAEN
jgi:hypothetical protein